MEVKKDQQQIELRPASLGRALKKGLSDAWDHLGLVIAASLAWSIAILIPMAIGWEVQGKLHDTWPWAIVCGILGGVLISTPLLAGVFKMAYNTVYHEDPALNDILDGARELLTAGYSVIGINILVIVVLLTNAAFFFGIFGPLKENIGFYLIGALFLYLFVLWRMMSLYHLPALAAQKPLKQRPGAIAAIKKSFILTMHNPVFTIELFAITIGISVLCIVSMVGMLILYMGVISIILTHALRELFARYGIVEEPQESPEKSDGKLD